MPEFHERESSRLAVFSGWKALLILPTLVFGLAAYAGSFLLPLQYISEALIIVRPRDIPHSYVPDIMRGSPEQRLRVIEQQVRSRSNIVKLLNEFGARLPELRPYDANDKVEKVRNAISIEFEIQVDPATQSRSVPYFRIRYQSEDPELAKAVASSILKTFLEADARTREGQINGTREFLETQLDSVARRLEQSELLSRSRPESNPRVAADYEVLQSRYRSLAAQLEEVRTVIDLESRQRGEQFAVIDSPNLPTLPSGPNRIAIAGLGAAAGFVFGATAILGLYKRQRRILA